MPENLGEAIAWLQQYLNSIPAQWRDNAKIEIDSVGGYEGSHYAAIYIKYTRPQTDEEFAAQLEKLAADLDAKESQERAMLAALNAKYGASR